MNKEIVTALVHTPKQERKNAASTTTSMPRSGARPGKVSRRWLVSELEKTVKRNADLTQQLKTRDEIERNLVESKTRLERELALLKSRRAVGSHENEAIRERNSQLSQDVFLMKNILVRLNAELGSCQSKLRQYESKVNEAGIETANTEGGGKRAAAKRFLEGELGLFAPLVNAYEESLAEKEILIQDMRETLQRFPEELDVLVSENSNLRQRMANSEKQGEASYSNWLAVQRELALVQEHNLLLKRQAHLAQTKISQLKETFQSKLGEVTQERDDCSGKLAALREEHLLLKGRQSALELDHLRLKDEAADHIPKAVHSAYIAECKRLLDELKSRHEQERALLIKQTCTHESEIPQQSESQKIRELEEALAELEGRCARSERRKEALKSRLSALVTFSKELILEHENLLKAVGGELGLNAGLAARLDSIKIQLQGVEAETRDQIKMLDENIATQVERVNRQWSLQRNEIDNLRQQLHTKRPLTVDTSDTLPL